jgi:hypothetical protein
MFTTIILYWVSWVGVESGFCVLGVKLGLFIFAFAGFLPLFPFFFAVSRLLVPGGIFLCVFPLRVAL